MKLLSFALVGFGSVFITATGFAKSSVCSSHIPGTTSALSCMETNSGPRSVCLYDAGKTVIVQMRGDSQYNGIFEETLEKNYDGGTLSLSKVERSITTYAKTVVKVNANGEGTFENVYRNLNVFANDSVKSNFSITCENY